MSSTTLFEAKITFDAKSLKEILSIVGLCFKTSRLFIYGTIEDVARTIRLEFRNT